MLDRAMQRPTAGNPPAGTAIWAPYGAAVWALVFTFLHAVWAAGWYVALPKAEARWAFSRLWFWIYDVVVACLCALAVLVALALVQPWGRRVPRRVLLTLAWMGTGLLVLRAGGGVVQTAYLWLVDHYVPKPMHLYEVWFCLGAVLFGLSLWRFHKAERAA